MAELKHGNRNVLIGVNLLSEFDECILIGSNLKTTADRQLIIGNTEITISRDLSDIEYQQMFNVLKAAMKGVS